LKSFLVSAVHDLSTYNQNSANLNASSVLIYFNHDTIKTEAVNVYRNQSSWKL